MHKSAETLLARYQALAASGAIERDPAQLRAVAALDGLARELAPAQGLRQILGNLPFFKRQRRAPRGIYLWGDVGHGKTTLMDLFFAAAPVEAKRRVHFYAFMAEVHERLHRARRKDDRGRDPVTRVADDLARETRLLCFDEFAVSDIADATILARLFSVLFGAGVVLVATSNVAPRRLYEEGRNRDLFLPFIALLLERMTVIELSARADFRLEKSAAHQVFFVIRDARSTSEAQARIASCMGSASRNPTTIRINGRGIEAAATQERIARFDFAQICGRPLGAADYLALTKHFDAIIVETVPAMTFDRRDEARRLIALVDVLYESRTKLILTAETEAERLYCAAPGVEAQEFRRTVSRLFEMRSQQYIEDWERRVNKREDAPA